MYNFRKFLFLTSVSIKRPLVKKYYKKLQMGSQLTKVQLKEEQAKKLRELIKYSYNNIPYYSKLMKSLNLVPEDIVKVSDLEKLPILTKNIIKNNREDFIPINGISSRVVNGSTGGSTGDPLKYRMSESCYVMGFSCLLRGLGLSGYQPGDKMVILAGGSLVGKHQTLTQKVKDYMMNYRHYSSYGMNDELLNKYVYEFEKWRPRYLRGYVSSIYEFAKYVKKNGFQKKFKLTAIFTTAETLSQKQRLYIEEVFNAEVYDNYGLNDGGVSAYECKYHSGFHIDTERSVLECVDENNVGVTGEEGKIIATSLLNFDMPFLRYDTGDLGVLSSEQCECGSPYDLLKELKGRTTDVLRINNRIVGSPVLTVLMGKVDILKYQVEQVGPNSLIIRIEKGLSYKNSDENFICESLISQLGSVEIVFDYSESYKLTSAGKHKFIISYESEA